MFSLYKTGAQSVLRCRSRLSLSSSFSANPKNILVKCIQTASTTENSNNKKDVNKSTTSSHNEKLNPNRTIFEPQKTFINSTNKKVNDTSVIGKGVELLEGFENDGYDNKRIVVKGYDDHCFLINDVLITNQSVILFPSTMILWNGIREMKDITIESLSVFTLVYPTIEILFIGCGETMSTRFPVEIIKYFRDKGIVIEATDSANAAATFNVLNSEGRNVGAALLTLVPSSSDDITTTDMFMKELK